MIKKLFVDCSFKADYSERLADFLDSRGYQYGYNGHSCERRAAHNMPFITIDVTNGFYHGSKSYNPSVDWKKACDPLFYQLERNLPSIREINRKNARDEYVNDDHMRQPSKDGRKTERVWYTITGYPMLISAMNDDHLHNTILLVDRTLAMGIDTIGNNRDLAGLLNELEEERIHRGLHLPLIPYITLEYRKGNHHA